MARTTEKKGNQSVWRCNEVEAYQTNEGTILVCHDTGRDGGRELVTYDDGIFERPMFDMLRVDHIPHQNVHKGHVTMTEEAGEKLGVYPMREGKQLEAQILPAHKL